MRKLKLRTSTCWLQWRILINTLEIKFLRFVICFSRFIRLRPLIVNFVYFMANIIATKTLKGLLTNGASLCGNFSGSSGLGF